MFVLPDCMVGTIFDGASAAPQHLHIGANDMDQTKIAADVGLCKKCGSPKVIVNFTRNGRECAWRKCRECGRAKQREWKSTQGGASAVNREYARRNREKYLAHKSVESAVKSGMLVRQSCERCGADNAQAHHEDYSKRLEVNWLCPLHHKERHRELDAISGVTRSPRKTLVCPNGHPYPLTDDPDHRPPKNKGRCFICYKSRILRSAEKRKTDLEQRAKKQEWDRRKYEKSKDGPPLRGISGMGDPSSAREVARCS